MNPGKARQKMLGWVQGVSLHEFIDVNAAGAFLGKAYNGAEITPSEFDNRPGRTPEMLPPTTYSPTNPPVGGPSFAPGGSGGGGGGSCGSPCSRRIPVAYILHGHGMAGIDLVLG